ncbi:hypothetical protein ES332_D04G074800v1 [Gossypium tomentosum]|uniref:Uncharacterized protein n=1 Tax=Gossypium tomentosum TaxID=34277 RepID=A0A5D2LAK9_GOSTO|nr:hypothetical protein ES332_D04G074800v1 [Gossypium tomentosum]
MNQVVPPTMTLELYLTLIPLVYQKKNEKLHSDFQKHCQYRKSEATGLHYHCLHLIRHHHMATASRARERVL